MTVDAEEKFAELVTTAYSLCGCFSLKHTRALRLLQQQRPLITCCRLRASSRSYPPKQHHCSLHVLQVASSWVALYCYRWLLYCVPHLARLPHLQMWSWSRC